MRFLLLLRGDAAAEAAMTDVDRRAMVDDHIAYAAMLRERGAYVSGDPLDVPERGRVIRFDGPEPTVTDGPFVEAKEHLGGFLVIKASDLDEALAWGRRLAGVLSLRGADGVENGLAIEIRPFQH